MTSPSPVGYPRRVMEKKVGTTDVEETLSACRDWSQMPLDALASIFGKLNSIEILMDASFVCNSWFQAAKLPEVWRSVDITQHELLDQLEEEGFPLDWQTVQINCNVFCRMARVAVDRSAGQLEVFHGRAFVTDELLKYIVDRSPALKTVSLISCGDVYNKGFTQLVTKCPMLEDISLVNCHNVTGRDIYQATHNGNACALLKRFTVRNSPRINIVPMSSGEEAIGVAAMHELRSLTLNNYPVTNDGVAAILDGCPHLEYLDLRNCFKIVVDDALKARCATIKSLMLPCTYVEVANGPWAANQNDNLLVRGCSFFPFIMPSDVI